MQRGIAIGGDKAGQQHNPRSKDGFDQAQAPSLDGEWGEYWKIAERYSQRAKTQDREDLRQNIILNLAQAQTSRHLSHSAMLRVASYTVAQYWRTFMRTTFAFAKG